MIQQSLAVQLSYIATLFDLLGGEAFRARAFTSAARSVENFDGDFEALLTAKQLTKIKGIGKGIAEEIYQAVENNPTEPLLPTLHALQTQVPQGVQDLLKVSGLGAKKAKLLWEHGVDSLEALLSAAEAGTLTDIKGFGAKSSEKMVKGAHFALWSKGRMRLDEAHTLSHTLRAELETRLPTCQCYDGGEVRRGCETITHLVLIVLGPTLDELGKALQEISGISHSRLDTDAQLIRCEFGGYFADIYAASPQTFGAAYALLGSSPAFQERLTAAAAVHSWRLTPSGLFAGDTLLDAPDELTVFELLKLPWLPAELRDNESPSYQGQALIELADIRGTLHNHSTWSDGSASLETMIETGVGLNYRYYGTGDHSVSSYIANGLTPERVREQMKEVMRLRTHFEGRIQLLHGMEVDILKDGSLDYDDDLLAELDYTVVSVHSNFTLSQAEQTKRIIRAVESPYATILGHVSGRLLLRRPAYDVDMLAIIEACADTKTIIEINASPYRLDMDWRWVAQAQTLRCRFAINPDAHSPNGLGVMSYGVTAARKAGLRAVDVVNTAENTENLRGYFKQGS